MIQNSDLIRLMFSHNLEFKPTHYIYHVHPNRHNTLKEVLNADQRAARDIEELQNTIDRLKELRAALADRYNELSVMPYSLTLELTRYKGWRGHCVTYTVRIFRTYEDKSESVELRETFDGKNRHKAIARYKELAKTHPGINCKMDIEKAQWEK